MTEFEIKLEIPAARVDAVAAMLAAEPTTRMRLRALYVDTPDGALARHGIALRLRQEDGRWVQTAKATGRGPLDRLEHNVEVAASGDDAPHPDVARHDGTPLGDRLRAALGHAAADPPWTVVFETDVERVMRDVQQADSTLEVALDRGHITAARRSHTVRELEVELKFGDPVDALRLARQWTARHGLWLSTISKAQRGHLLAQGEVAGPPVGAEPAHYPRKASPGEIVQAVLASCLAQVVGNASEIAAGSCDNDHVHQLRVGIRRLRTALRELQPLAALDAGCEPALIDTFRALGQHRDQFHVTRSLEPQVEAAGGPLLATASLGPPVPDPGEVVRAPAFQDALLELLGQQARPAPGKGSARKPLRRGLQRLWRQVVRDGARFTALDETLQHRVRKRLKRLRYLADFAQPLFPGHGQRAFLADLKPVQDALGSYNDALMALSAYRAMAQADAKALFGVGWLTAQREPLARACEKSLRRLARKADPFWT
ncbi:MAG: CYTH and CHAD domain-containing protein [Ramlibacter sp.]